MFPQSIGLIWWCIDYGLILIDLQAAVKTALRMNDPRFTMSIYEEAGDIFFKGHRNRLASLPFYRVWMRGCY